MPIRAVASLAGAWFLVRRRRLLRYAPLDGGAKAVWRHIGGDSYSRIHVYLLLTATAVGL